MRRNGKRIATLLLTVCLIFSAVAPGTVAAEETVTTYDLDLVGNGYEASTTVIETAKTGINDRYATALWKWEDTNIENLNNIKFYEAGMTSLGTVSSWIAIRIKSPGTGLYTLGLNYATHPQSGTVAVHVLPGDTTDIAAALDLESRVGKLSLWEENQSGLADYRNNFETDEAYVGTCQLAAGQEYIVVFEASEASPYHTTRAYMAFSALTLTQGDVFVAAEKTPIPSPVVVDAGPVTLLEGCYYGTTMLIDGKDYMFEPVEGKKLLAFNMDSFTREYEADIPFLVTRGITADEEGNLWLCGDNKFLYRFDPRSRMGEKTKSFASADAEATSAYDVIYAEGCLYFGTNPTGSLIKYDIAKDEFTQLYTNGGSYANGLVCKGDYLYAGIYDVSNSANQSWKVVKVNVNDTTDVTTLDIVGKMPSGSMFYDAALAGDLLLFGGGNSQTQMIAVDPDTMTLEELNIDGGICYSISEEVDGKVYFVMNHKTEGMGLYAFDVRNKTADRLMTTKRPLHCVGRSIIQVDDADYPGYNIAVYATATGEPMLYNLEKKITKSGAALIEGYGTSTYIHSLINGPANSGDLYMGAYNVKNCAIYNTTTKTFEKFTTLGQTDSLCYYDGNLYAGNYADGAIVRVDLENSKNNEILLKLNDDTYDQARIHTLTAGEDKIFAGTTPDKGAYGGCLAWVSTDGTQSHVVRNIVQDQTVNCIVYHDGLIYGTTSIYGGANTAKRSDLSAKLFVYDVKTEKPLAVFDLRDYMDGFEEKDSQGNITYGTDGEPKKINIDFISGIAADPKVKENGRFWGLVSETLFSFTYDKETNALTVTEELSYSKTTYADGGGRTWFPKPFCFDNDGNLYLAFGDKGGMRKISTDNTQENTRLPIPEPLYYALGEDGNLYYGISSTLYMYPLSTSATESANAAAVDELIEQITDPVTLDQAQTILDARQAYEQLSLEERALVQNLDVLEEAEIVLLDLQIQDLENISAYEYKAQVMELHERYQAMTDWQKGYVKNTEALSDAYNTINAQCYIAADTIFSDLAEAVEMAKLSQSKTVTMIGDATENEMLLTDGVILDLNGHTLTIKEFRANIGDGSCGYVVDSSEGNNGLLQTNRGDELFDANNPDLPLYDAGEDAGGYRFFDYKLEIDEVTEKVGTGREKFWFKFHFYTNDSEGAALDQDAYDLIKAGGSDFEISVQLVWNGTELPPVYFGYNGNTDEFSKAWANAATEKTWLYLIVGGLDKVGLGKLTVQPVLTVDNVKVTGDLISYEKKIGSIGGWDDVGPTNK